MTNTGSKIKYGNALVGEVFTARKSFPSQRTFAKDEEIVQYIQTDELFKVGEYQEETDTYHLLNLSLDSEDAWFLVDSTELDYILRRGATK